MRRNATRKVSKRGYLFVAPWDWDFSNPVYRTKPEPLTGKVHSSTIITATKVTNTVQQEKGTDGMVEMQIKSFSQRHGLMSTAGSGSSRARYASSS
uniref:Uncharacterized protein n=1 Tax=Anopheles quadriannulatus TaxID=34691 RepID=A0A182X336_ANOQN